MSEWMDGQMKIPNVHIPILMYRRGMMPANQYTNLPFLYGLPWVKKPPRHITRQVYQVQRARPPFLVLSLLSLLSLVPLPSPKIGAGMHGHENLLFPFAPSLSI